MAEDDTPLSDMAWLWRVELCVALLAGLIAWWLVSRVGRPLGGGLLGLALATTLLPGRHRSFVSTLLYRLAVRRRVEAALMAADLSGLGRRPGRCHYLGPVPAGDQVDIRLSPGADPAALERGAQVLAASLRVTAVTIRRDRTDASRVMLTLARRDPLAEMCPPWPFREASRTDVFDPLPLGLNEEGEVVGVELVGHHLLVGGEPGAGKSVALSLVVAAAALDQSCELFCFDPKLVELAAWRGVATKWCGPDLHEATELLQTIRGGMELRYEVLLAKGLRKIGRSEDMGPVLVVIDELHAYLTHPDRRAAQGFAEVLRDLVARGRAAGVCVVAATQKPATDVVPSSIRDLFGYRLALRCTTRDASDTVLGAGWASLGYSAAEIDPATRGVGLLLAEGGAPQRLRCFHLDDREIADIAGRVEGWR